MYPMFQQQIIRVNGENGAKAYQLPPNSSALLLDENQPLVWMVQTDALGYSTTMPFKIEEYHPEPEPDLRMILERLNELEVKLNAKSDNSTHANETERKSNRSSNEYVKDGKC